MIKTNDTTYNIAKSVKCLVIKSHLSFFLKEDKVAFNEKKQMDIVIILDQEKGQGGMEKGQGGRSALSLY